MRSSRSSRPDTDWLTERPYAHRGLHGAGRLENSRAAFEAAIEAGFGIELDVQASHLGFAMVFHDTDLDRLTSETGRVSGWADEDLVRVRLKGSEETIPPLEEILRLVDGQVPLLIEVKVRGPSYHQLCHSVARDIADYRGPVAVMSFNPRVGHWFARHYPQFTRGLVVSEEGKKDIKGRIERRLSLRWARPHFLAYDIRDLPSRFASGERKRGLPVLTWTVRNRRDEEIASAFADQIIHELPSIR